MQKGIDKNTGTKRTPNTIFSDSDDLQAYFKKIQQYPLLDPDTEYELAQDWIEKQDTKAAERLVTSHLRLVTRVAAGYRGYGLPMADMIAEGNIGILQALRKFDVTKGFRFSTYAVWWIKAAIQDYILRSWSLVKIGTTAAQRKLFFNLNKLKRQLHSEGHFSSLSNESIASISKELGVEEAEVRSMEKRLLGGDASLNAPITNSNDGVAEWQDWIESDSASQEETFLSKEQKQKESELLRESFQCLTPREMAIIKARRLKEPPDTLEMVGETFHISKERVRQLEVIAFEKLRKHIKNLMTRYDLE